MLVEEALRRHDVVERMLAEHARRTSDIERHFRFLRRLLGLRKVFMEVAAGDCALAHRVAGYVERAYAVHLSCSTLRAVRAGNLVPVRCDGAQIPVPSGSVDVAFSRGCPAQQLPGIHRALVPGGRYICIAPPSSRDVLLAAGFRRLRAYAQVGRWVLRMPLVPPFLQTLCIQALK